MCACDVGFVCAKCQGTPFDPRYQEDEHEPLSSDEFDALVGVNGESWAFGANGWL